MILHLLVAAVLNDGTKRPTADPILEVRYIPFTAETYGAITQSFIHRYSPERLTSAQLNAVGILISDRKRVRKEFDWMKVRLRADTRSGKIILVDQTGHLQMRTARSKDEEPRLPLYQIARTNVGKLEDLLGSSWERP